jgi:hypothetical protein
VPWEAIDRVQGCRQVCREIAAKHLGTSAPTSRRPLCRFDGKITGVSYDCFGDFEGFALDICGKEIQFSARTQD